MPITHSCMRMRSLQVRLISESFRLLVALQPFVNMEDQFINGTRQLLNSLTLRLYRLVHPVSACRCVWPVCLTRVGQGLSSISDLAESFRQNLIRQELFTRLDCGR
jgi:hypothetical protein